jgi:hypothetical protein
MGKGIAILFYLIMIPSTIILIITWIITYWKYKKHIAGKILLAFWGLFIGGIVLLYFTESYFRPAILTNEDIYGSYIVDKEKFPGKQADWQYENFRLRITNNNLILESRIDDNIWKSEEVKISFSSGYFDLDKEEYCNRKIRIHSDSTNHHIIRDNPTLYRESFNNFYYVFESVKFGNMFFRKGEWK